LPGFADNAMFLLFAEGPLSEIVFEIVRRFEIVDERLDPLWQSISPLFVFGDYGRKSPGGSVFPLVSAGLLLKVLGEFVK